MNDLEGVFSPKGELANAIPGYRERPQQLEMAQAIRQAIEATGVLVAEARGPVIGAATYFFVPVVHDTRPWCRITTLIVDEAHRGQGIGRALLAAVEATARDAGCARIGRPTPRQ